MSDAPHRFTSDNPYKITTTERSLELHRARKAARARSTLKGLADISAAGIDVDSMDDDQLIQAAGDTIRLLTRHMGEQFLKSANVRGLSESYSKLLEALTDDRTNTTPGTTPGAGMISASVETLLELVDQIETHKRLQLDKARAVNVDAERWSIEQQNTGG